MRDVVAVAVDLDAHAVELPLHRRPARASRAPSSIVGGRRASIGAGRPADDEPDRARGRRALGERRDGDGAEVAAQHAARGAARRAARRRPSAMASAITPERALAQLARSARPARSAARARWRGRTGRSAAPALGRRARARDAVAIRANARVDLGDRQRRLGRRRAAASRSDAQPTPICRWRSSPDEEGDRRPRSRRARSSRSSVGQQRRLGGASPRGAQRLGGRRDALEPHAGMMRTSSLTGACPGRGWRAPSRRARSRRRARRRSRPGCARCRFSQRRNSIATGQMRASAAASWPAPLGRSRAGKPSAPIASASTARSRASHGTDGSPDSSVAVIGTPRWAAMAAAASSTAVSAYTQPRVVGVADVGRQHDRGRG